MLNFLRKHIGYNSPIRRGWHLLRGVVAAVLYGFPGHQLQVRMDEQRQNDLSLINNQITEYWRVKRVLPVDLEDLKNSPINYGFFSKDPQTQEDYTYVVTGELDYRLCAVFDLASPLGMQAKLFEDWTHVAGENCFDRSIDPEFYPKSIQ